MTSCKVWTTVAHHNSPETFCCRDCLPQRFRLPRKEGKPFSNRLWSNLIGIQVSTVSCEALKHAPTVQPFRDIWF